VIVGFQRSLSPLRLRLACLFSALVRLAGALGSRMVWRAANRRPTGAVGMTCGGAERNGDKAGCNQETPSVAVHRSDLEWSAAKGYDDDPNGDLGNNTKTIS
jgi:hypothetical protein